THPPPTPCFPLAGHLEASFQLWVEPAVPVVAHGGSVRLRLNTTCQDLAGKVSWETTLETGPQGEKVLELLNVTSWGTEVQVNYDCGKETETAWVRVITYSAPKRPQLKPLAALAVGEEQEVVCRVAGAAPIRNLSVVLSCGTQVLRSQTFNSTNQKPEEVQVKHLLKAERWHNGHNLSCQALLDLAPHGPTLNATSEPQLVTVYDFPEDPKLDPDLQLEVDEVAKVTCSAPSAFPVPTFQMTLGNRSLSVSVSPDGHNATAEVSHKEQGHYQLLCEVAAGPRQRQAKGTVHVYSEWWWHKGGGATWCPQRGGSHH
ncbi:ICAM1 protein, partial [Ramphastos sulfuratus]|nr:ICAM1 protein [Ramphastos sulfuratus]